MSKPKFSESNSPFPQVRHSTTPETGVRSIKAGLKALPNKEKVIQATTLAIEYGIFPHLCLPRY